MMKKKHGKDRRWLIQTIASLASNSHFAGFLGGQNLLYKGELKKLCVPSLNCYTCPGAVGSCPIGSLQAVVGGKQHNFSFYVVGSLMLFGLLLGRAVCGFLCLFGFVQDLLYKIPVPKLKVPARLDKGLRYLKYLFLVGMVMLLPLLLKSIFGLSPPPFCSWLCPAGTLEAGLPMIALDQGLRGLIGFLFYWKLAILVLVLLASVFIHRPFCKYLCPLGAFYGLFAKVGLYRMKLDHDKCINCGRCERACPMDVAVRKDINVAECIRCGTCKRVCPTGAIRTTYGFRDRAPAQEEVPTPTPS